MSLLPLLVVIVAIAAFHGSAAAQSALSPAALQACDALTAKVVKATGVDVLGRSPTGLQVYLSSPFAKDISLECVDPGNPSYAHPAFSASFHNDHPSLPYYDTLAIGAGVALGFFCRTSRRQPRVARRRHWPARTRPRPSMPVDISISSVTLSAVMAAARQSVCFGIRSVSRRWSVRDCWRVLSTRFACP